MRTLVVRADAGPTIGVGHLMRCLALAQAWEANGGEVVFITACRSDILQKRLLDEGFEVVKLEHPHPAPDDLERTCEVLAEHPGAWVVLDGYHFDSPYQVCIKEKGHPLLVIDDTAHLEHYYADAIMNQNLHAGELEYRCEPDTKLLTGTKYVLLRREFLKWRGWKRAIPDVGRKVLVTLGGGDPENLTRKVIHALQRLQADGLEAVVVAGVSNPHYAELRSAIGDSPFSLRMESSQTNMSDLMAWADVAVTGGGSTCWELAFMGLPSIALILADNQERVVERLQVHGAVINGGMGSNVTADELTGAMTGLLTDPAKRSVMAKSGRELVDGEGAERVVGHLSGCGELVLRPAREEDCRLIWEWANDSDARAASFSSKRVPWDRHIKWFTSKINDTHCLFYVVTDCENRPIGQIRFDIEGDNATVSISLDRQARGKGYASKVIRMGSQKAFDSLGVRCIQAYIKPNNQASLRAFMKAGFKNHGHTRINGHDAVRFVLTKEEKA